MINELNRLVTILVPTYNRPNFLARLVSYYVSINLPSDLHVLDSSSDTEKTAALIQNLNQSNIHHHKFPTSISPLNKLYEGISHVNTPFVVIWADDDFLTQSTFTESVNHLINNTSCSSTHGESALFTRVPDKPIDIGPYEQKSYEANTASRRLIDYLSNYCVLLYSVQRTDNLCENLQKACKYEMGYIWGEVIMGCLSVIQGHVNKLSHLHMVREAHPEMDSWATSDSPHDVFEWVTNKHFAEAYTKFRHCIAETLVVYDKISYAEALKVTSEAFFVYIQNQFNESDKVNKYQSMKSKLKPLVVRTNLGEFIWSQGRSMLPNDRGRISLPNLMKPKSPYHNDFHKIHISISSD